ncbi:MAG: hypothetical protein U0074_25705 [Kouleothrix sp.]|jgi:hypothetical protein
MFTTPSGVILKRSFITTKANLLLSGFTQLRYCAYQRCAFCLRQQGSIDHFGVRFFRAKRGKIAHEEKIKYRSAAGSARQLRKP